MRTRDGTGEEVKKEGKVSGLESARESESERERARERDLALLHYFSSSLASAL